MLKKRLLWTAVILLAVAGAVTGHIDKASEEQAESAYLRTFCRHHNQAGAFLEVIHTKW